MPANFKLGKLTARPLPPQAVAAPEPGLHGFALHPSRDTLLFIPKQLEPPPVPLVILLHGSGSDAKAVLPLLTDRAEKHGFLVLAPQSREHTWDIIIGRYGPDVEQLNRAMTQVFAHFAIDPARLGIAGFSDGASYALSLGLINGALFSHIFAFSPGFAAPTIEVDRPFIFISHGRRDPVLQIEHCGRRLARLLSAEGYDLDYREFDGEHEVPDTIVDAAVDRLMTRHRPEEIPHRSAG